MNRLERLKFLVGQLKKRGLVLSQKDLGQKIGYNNESAFSQVLNGKVPEPRDFISRILEHYPMVNRDWVYNGIGEVFLDAHTDSTPPSESSSNTRQVIYFPDCEATGGNALLFGDGGERSINLAIPHSFDCDYALPLVGDSMTPLYRAGCIILVKEWRESFIEYGKVYLIVTEQGNRMVKYLRPAETPEEILCTSENPSYEPFTILRSSIKFLYVVKGCIYQHSL